MPLKMLFDSFRYLNQLPRYEDSNFPRWLRRRWRENREWDPMTRIFFPGNVYYVFPEMLRFSKNYVYHIWN